MRKPLKILEKISTHIGNNQGLTLIELVIVVAIIGILTAIAIPRFTEYKKQGYDSQAKNDLHNLYEVCKAYWVDTSGANNCDLATATQNTYGFNPSANVTLTLNNTTETTFDVLASHSSSANSFQIDFTGNITKQ